MPLIVDTFNVLHQTGVLPPSLAGIDVAGLIELIQRSRFRRSRVRLVCDGTSNLPADVGAVGHIVIEFSGKGRTADDVIARHVNRSTAPKRLTVISSDREVQKAARRRRCTVLRSEEFLRQLAMDVEREERKATQKEAKRPAQFARPLTQRDTAKWMREFGVDEHKPALTEEELQEIDAAADKLLRGEKETDEAGEEREESPELSRAEARKKRAKERERKTLEERDRSEGPPLPIDVLAEAERLWRRERENDRSP